jgi:hypothetical protein
MSKSKQLADTFGRTKPFGGGVGLRMFELRSLRRHRKRARLFLDDLPKGVGTLKALVLHWAEQAAAKDAELARAQDANTRLGRRYDGCAERSSAANPKSSIPIS